MDSIRAIESLSKLATIVRMSYEAYRIVLQRMSRRWWVRPINLRRDEIGFHRTCTTQLRMFDEEHFLKATRMSDSNFKCLLTLLQERLQRFSNRKPVSPEMRLSLTLLYLAQGCNFQILAWAHKLGFSTVRKIVYDTCDAIWQELHTVYVAVPNLIDYMESSEAMFIKTGMPNCLGAIDGKHINIHRPKRSGSLYFNYKKNFSIVLLAACDAKYCFTFVDVGALGSQSDGGILVRSDFGRRILNGTLAVPPNRLLPDGSRSFPYYFVADSAFPLQCNIMKPFPGRDLSSDKQEFNKTLSKARVHIENTFAILANRWQVLQTTINASPDNADKIVLATVVLHNFLMLKNDSIYLNAAVRDEIEECIRTGSNLRSVSFNSGNRSSSGAFVLRDILKEYINRNVNSNM